MLIDAEKAFGLIQHPFTVKTLSKLGMEGSFLEWIKDNCRKLSANEMLPGEKRDVFSLKMKNKAMMLSFTSPAPQRTGSPR